MGSNLKKCSNLEAVESLDIDDFRWVNAPLWCDRTDYTETINRYIDFISRYSDVIAAYQIGNISVPGVSDLDLILVLKDRLEDSKPHNYSIVNLDNKDRYFFMHSPYFLNEHVFTNIRKYFPVFDLKLLYGKELFVKEVEQGHKELVGLSSVIEYIPYLMSNYLDAILSRAANIRVLLCFLNSLKYSMMFVWAFAEELPTAGEYEKLVAFLRNTAPKHESLPVQWRKAFLRALKLGLELILEMINKVSGILVDGNFLGDWDFKGYGSIHISARHSYIFVAQWSKAVWRSGINNSRVKSKYLNHYIEVFPLVFLRQYLIYAASKGPVSDFLRENIILYEKTAQGLLKRTRINDNDVMPNSSYSNILWEKRNLINEQAEFLASNGFKTGQLAAFQFFNNLPFSKYLIRSLLTFTNRNNFQHELLELVS
jgi:hypothetical protein